MVVTAYTWQPAVGVLGGVAMVALGVASSRGSFRRWEPWYRDPGAPFYLRNAAFALVPFGIAILGITGAGLTSSDHAVSSVGVIIFFLGIVLGVIFMIRPPDFVKPPWAREAEDIK